MRSSAIIVGLLSLLGSAAARKHHNCGCELLGKYDTGLTSRTCNRWDKNGNPNTHFDGYSCVDKGLGRGIDGAPWQVACRQQWESEKQGNLGTDVRGRCWK